MHNEKPASSAQSSFLLPLILVTSLFFLWGLSYGLLDVLNKHFQESLHVGKASSGWLQAAYFGAYFVASFPAGRMMQQWGYKSGIIVGLLLYAGGALLFIPASMSASFPAFLGALFVLACGLSCLETAANPYITVLGPPQTAEQRLNLSQSFNGLGSFIGPLIGGALFFTVNGGAGGVESLRSIAGIYAAIAALVLVVAFTFYKVHLPEIRESAATVTAPAPRLGEQRNFVFAVAAQFFYVAAQVGVGAFFINFATEHWQGLTSQRGAYLLSVGLLCFLVGRFVTTALMSRIAPALILAFYGGACTLLTLVVVCGIEKVSVVALVAVFFFMSIMFPTIFSLGIRNLGALTKRGSSYMVAAIVGGAILPYCMGAVAERTSTATAYLLPAACFAVVFLYAWRGRKLQ